WLAVRALLRNRRAYDLHGRTVLITGGSRGLGLLLAREFAREGARIALWARAVRNRFGSVDVLVNNAGIIQVGPMEEMLLEDYEAAMQIHFWATVYTTLAVLPEMRQRGSGRIVNITSIGGKISPPHLLPYNASKFAQVGFSEGLRAELAKDGVLVTTVCP